MKNPLAQAEGHYFVGIGLPRSESAERTKHSETALQLAEQAGDSMEALRIKAKIANSFAEQLIFGGPKERETARGLFQTSVEIKRRAELRDVQGLAFAHGGLGRLRFEAKQ